MKRYSDRHRAVICKNWLRPIRTIVLSSLLLHIVWRAFHQAQFYTFAIILIHCLIAFLLLAECRRSEHYHQTIEEFDRREAVLKEDNSPPSNT
jgi:uncharacterized membrane protein YqjE